MSHLLLDELPDLRNPTFVAAFRGWNDTGEAATVAVRHVVDSCSAQPFATIDPEEFFDFTVARPMIRATEDGLSDLRWPSNRFYYHRRNHAEGDLVLMLGTEPHLKWRAFTETVRDLYQQLNGCRLVTVGAHAGPSVHTRPLPISGFATEEKLRQALDGLAGKFDQYEGPTGIVGALHAAWREFQAPSAGLWISLPAYLGNLVNPRGALSLLETLDPLLALELDLTPLVQASQEFARALDQPLAENEQLQSYIAEMERRIDAGAPQQESLELPPSNEIIGDLEEFLRHRRSDG